MCALRQKNKTNAETVGEAICVFAFQTDARRGNPLFSQMILSFIDAKSRRKS